MEKNSSKKVPRQFPWHAGNLEFLRVFGLCRQMSCLPQSGGLYDQPLGFVLRAEAYISGEQDARSRK